MKDGILQAKFLRIGYRSGDEEKILFKDLDVTLNRGQFVSLMGPNGSGKSTLIRTLAHLQPALHGDIRVDGHTNTDPTKIAIVLTDKPSALNMTVEELITYGRYPYLNWNLNLSLKDRNAIDEALDKIHLRDLKTKRLFELSDGQLQMTMIARALAQNTPILLLDEPTAHLDLNNRLEIMNLLKELSRTENKAILVSTHELDLALQTADLIWLAGKNQTLSEGFPEDLVLQGVFDDIFRFKGFDLKTGKVEHRLWRETPIRVTGDGPAFLWTKNALERNGFEVRDDAGTRVTLERKAGTLHWILHWQENSLQANTLASLIKLIESNVCSQHL